MPCARLTTVSRKGMGKRWSKSISALVRSPVLMQRVPDSATGELQKQRPTIEEPTRRRAHWGAALGDYGVVPFAH
jgi:hypothetical protein